VRNLCLSLVPFFFGVAGLEAIGPSGKILQETWDAAYLDNHPAGYVHTSIRHLELNGETIIKTEVELHLTVKRFKDSIHLRMASGTEETPSGKVVGVYMRQFVGEDQQVNLRGMVEGETLHVKVDGGRRLDKKIPWSDQVVGLHRLERLFSDRQLKPGDRFSYLAFDPTFAAVLTVRVWVKDYEEIALPQSNTKQRLLRVEAVPDKIAGVQPSAVYRWFNTDGLPVQSQTDMPGLGKMTLYRTTRQKALGQVSPAAAPNIGLNQLIPTQRIDRPYDREYGVYRVTIKDDTDPVTAFVQDPRQEIKNVRGNSFVLYVRAPRKIGVGNSTKEPGPEFRKSCYFINCDDSKVRLYARQAVGTETDEWLKARQIELWVHTHMKNDHRPEAFAPADQVARTLEGDCTEYAMLTAAMCRAAGIPSRAALGLLYVESVRGPSFGFHMWTEVWVQGQWIPIDATLGRGFVGATHLKISDHSWYNTQSLTPLLSVARVVGKISIDVEN
jgi:hypothetical protein